MITCTWYAYYMRTRFFFALCRTFAPENEKHLARVRVRKPKFNNLILSFHYATENSKIQK